MLSVLVLVLCRFPCFLLGNSVLFFLSFSIFTALLSLLIALTNDKVGDDDDDKTCTAL